MTHSEQVRFARRFVARIPGQPDIHGVEFPSGRVLADTEVGLTEFLTVDVITEDYEGAVIHWADEPTADPAGTEATHTTKEPRP